MRTALNYDKESHNPSEIAVEEKRRDQRRLERAAILVSTAVCFGSLRRS
jgi:hypothetical protein